MIKNEHSEYNVNNSEVYRIPAEIIVRILSFLDAADIANSAVTCRLFAQAVDISQALQTITGSVTAERFPNGASVLFSAKSQQYRLLSSNGLLTQLQIQRPFFTLSRTELGFEQDEYYHHLQKAEQQNNNDWVNHFENRDVHYYLCSPKDQMPESATQLWNYFTIRLKDFPADMQDHFMNQGLNQNHMNVPIRLQADLPNHQPTEVGTHLVIGKGKYLNQSDALYSKPPTHFGYINGKYFWVKIDVASERDRGIAKSLIVVYDYHGKQQHAIANQEGVLRIVANDDSTLYLERLDKNDPAERFLKWNWLTCDQENNLNFVTISEQVVYCQGQKGQLAFEGEAHGRIDPTLYFIQGANKRCFPGSPHDHEVFKFFGNHTFKYSVRQQAKLDCFDNQTGEKKTSLNRESLFKDSLTTAAVFSPNGRYVAMISVPKYSAERRVIIFSTQSGEQLAAVKFADRAGPSGFTQLRTTYYLSVENNGDVRVAQPESKQRWFLRSVIDHNKLEDTLQPRP